jgi:hypothetical protein
MIPARKKNMINSKRMDSSALAVYSGDARPISAGHFFKPIQTPNKNECQ